MDSIDTDLVLLACLTAFASFVLATIWRDVKAQILGYLQRGRFIPVDLP